MQKNDLAPDFSLSDQDGNVLTLSTLLHEGPVVLFFYPAAMTTGCTKESCSFRDLGKEFAALGAQRIGISMDSVARQSQFATKYRLDFPVLSDEEGKVATDYGVKRALKLLKVRRSTFVIDTDRHIVDIINSEINMDAHAQRALKALEPQRR